MLTAVSTAQKALFRFRGQCAHDGCMRNSHLDLEVSVHIMGV